MKTQLSKKENNSFESQVPFKDCIMIKINKRYKKFLKHDIDFVSSDGKYANLHIGTRTYSVRSSLKEVSEKLPNVFLRIHASYIVNTNKIQSINTELSCVEFEKGISIPYSRKYKSNLFGLFSIL